MQIQSSIVAHQGFSEDERSHSTGAESTYSTYSRAEWATGMAHRSGRWVEVQYLFPSLPAN